MKLLFVIGLGILLLTSFAFAGEIEDTATELTVLMVGRPDPARIDAEIADARTRVKRRYVDDKTTEVIVTGGYTANIDVLVDGEFTTMESWEDVTETRSKEPADDDILARLNLKLESIKRSMKSSVDND